MNKSSSLIFFWTLLSAAMFFQRGLSQTASQGLDVNTTANSLENSTPNTGLVIPGTKWCGAGDTANSDDDLGTFSTTDRCCRDHDHCFDSIKAGETKYGLTNNGLLTRMHCDCDSQFYSCLKRANTRISTSTGCTFFTVLGMKCFKEDYPIVGCKKYELGRCVEYETDQTAEKKYQWFDNPTYPCI